MKINYLFIELVCSILLYSLVVKADSDFKGECQNLKNIAHACKVDSQGKIIYIQMYNDEGLSDKDWEKLLSYKTIKELYLSGIDRTGITQKIVDRIGKLTNLEKLEFGYYTIFDKNLKYDSFKNLSKVSELGIIGSEDEKTLEKNIIKNFKNLKNLDIRNAKFNKDIISEINSLTKIEKMKLYEIEMEDNLNYDLKNVYELEIDDSVIAKNFLGSLKNLKKLIIFNDIYIKQYHADEISTLSNLEEIEYKVHYSEKDVIDFSSFKNLKNLTRCLIEISYDNLKVKNINNIKNLHLSVLNKITQSNINEIGKLTNVVYLRIIIGESDLDIDFSPINKKNINELEIVGSNDKYDHDKVLKKHIIKAFTNIKILSFDNIDFNQSDIDDISGLTQLEGLKFQWCYWNKISIEPLNKLPKLKYVDFTNNSSIEGKTLTNDSLEKCLYSTYPELCIAKDMKCFTEEVKAALKPCSSSSNDKISTNGQCGVVNGICPSDECCSKYGYCGTSDKHCYSGCQPEYGKCKGTSSSTSKTTTFTKTKTTKSTTKTSSLPISTNDKCGPKDGRCPSDKCCSKYGWCGTSDSHCGSGCQSEFGKCKKSSTSTTTTSKKTTKKTTSKTKTTTKKTSTKKTTSKSSLPISTNDKCGPKDGRCPSGECCSKYGWCGTSDSHCGSGCQSDYGKCK